MSIIRFLCLFLSLILPVVAYAEAPEKQLSEKLQRLESFQGEFQQTLIDNKGELLQESTGIFTLLRPGYFRWETLQPFPQLLISNLETIWLYDPDLEQVTVKAYDQRIAQTPALLLSGDASKIAQHYRVVKKSDTQFQLNPLDSEALFTELLVNFEQQQLSQMQLIDSLGQTTTFTFINGVYNQPTDKQQFEFTPPQGADVIIGN